MHRTENEKIIGVTQTHRQKGDIINNNSIRISQFQSMLRGSSVFKRPIDIYLFNTHSDSLLQIFYPLLAYNPVFLFI
jgi:hypothetical protein